MSFLGVSRAYSTMTATGGSHHVRIPKPLIDLLGWETGEELIVTITPEKAMHVQTLEAYFRERLAEERQRQQPEFVGADA